jgi:hypothetical protein
MNNLFEKFPVITYGDSVAINLFAKVKLSDTVLKNSSLYYPYTIKDGERPEHVALNYYGDARYVWVVFLCNKLVDPYYEWPLDPTSFDQHIINKYGSFENAVEKTAFYRVTYDNDDRILDQSLYQALPARLKKYWNPVTDNNNTTLYYTRKQQELVVDTNKIVQFYVNNATSFTVGEIVKQSNTSGGLLGKAIIKNVESDRLIVKHVEGTFANTTGVIGNVVGSESSVNAAASNVTTLYTALDASEFIYWEPVSYYTYETELNTSRTFIKLIDSGYVDTIEKEIQDLL